MVPDFSRSPFYLRKWYLDAADAEGKVYIGYWASLKWHKLRLHYYQHLWHSPAGGVQSHSRFSYEPEPAWRDETELCWQPENLHLHWHSLAESLEETLLENDDGLVHWRCSQPKALANIEFPQFSLSGWGYIECIEISIPFWKLPIKTLYWGRCHSDGHYLVWIRWQGSSQQNLVWHNGKRSETFSIHSEQICGADFQLNLGENTCLREGQVGSTIFHPFSAITQKFPEKILRLYEQKWYNRGQLLSGDCCEKAISIYEKVEW